MPYDMKVLPDNVSSITDIMPEDQNIIMPVFIPDSFAQYYLVGKVDDESNLDSAFGFLTLDAQNILTESLPRAFSFIDSDSVDKIFQNVGNPLIVDAWADAVALMRSSIRVSPSFRGVVAANPMSFLGDSAERAYEKVHNGEFSYKERASKIKELPSAAKKMRSEDKSVQEEAPELADNKTHLGVMAQEMEQNPVLENAVEETEEGTKVVDVKTLTMDNTALLADLAKRFNALEERLNELFPLGKENN